MKRDEREEVIYRALQGVETPEYDILGAVKAAREEIPRRRRPHLTRAALLAACLAAALTVGALAAGLTVGWDSFLGRTPRRGGHRRGGEGRHRGVHPHLAGGHCGR